MISRHNIIYYQIANSFRFDNCTFNILGNGRNSDNVKDRENKSGNKKGNTM